VTGTPAGAGASDRPPQVGDLVVIDGVVGVLRIERVVADGRFRCFSYVHGGFVVVDADVVRPCPPGTRAAP
jgi:hypothetical protein